MSTQPDIFKPEERVGIDRLVGHHIATGSADPADERAINRVIGRSLLAEDPIYAALVYESYVARTRPGSVLMVESWPVASREASDWWVRLGGAVWAWTIEQRAQQGASLQLQLPWMDLVCLFGRELLDTFGAPRLASVDWQQRLQHPRVHLPLQVPLWLRMLVEADRTRRALPARTASGVIAHVQALCAAHHDWPAHRMTVIMQPVTSAVLDETRGLLGSGASPRSHEHALVVDALVADRPVRLVLVHERLHREQTSRVAIPLVTTQPLDDAPREQDLRSLLGRPLHCAHASGRWERNGTADDALLLSCPDCGRYRIGCVPLHQHPTTATITRSYISRERGYRLLRGDRQTISAELLLRDPRRSLDLADYAGHQPTGRIVDPRRILRSRRRR